MRKTKHFLSQREIEFVLRRVEHDRGDSQPEKFTLGKFLRPALDLKIWGFAIIFWLGFSSPSFLSQGLTVLMRCSCLTTVSYGIAFFLPIILREGLQFNLALSQCLVAPPYVCAAILMLGTAWVADKYHIRGPILIFNSVVTLIGLPVMVINGPPFFSFSFFFFFSPQKRCERSEGR